MEDEVRFMVRIEGSPDLINGLVKGPAAASDVVVESVGPADQSSHLRLGLTEVETLVAVVNGIATLSKFAWVIYEHLRGRKSEQLTVQTPVHTVVILASDAESPERIKELLEQSARI